MFSTLRTRFGIPGVISVIALVFAMFGGAYAASNSSDGGKATASAKAKKGPRGPRGETGPAGPSGPAGPAGPQGPTGPKGENGSPGSDGASGSQGAPGQSVQVETEAPFGHCGDQEGVKITSAEGVNYVCNGTGGSGGGGGGFPEELPAGKTETGAWSVQGRAASFGSQFMFAAISFNIPLANGLDSAHTIYVPGVGTNPDPAHCDGSSTEPKAASGYLCMYESAGVGTSSYVATIWPDGISEGAAKNGALLLIKPEDVANPELELPSTSYGSWAVTG